MSADNLILFKRSGEYGKIPSLSSLSAGELAVNFADGSLFTKTLYNNEESVATFLNLNKTTELINQLIPYSLNVNLSSGTTVFGDNSASEVFATVLGGYSNNNSGAGSTIINGEANHISADFAFIANGTNNQITPIGNYSSILGGSNNLISHQNSFTLGSNLSSHSNDFTYVNNISAIGEVYGNNILKKRTFVLGDNISKIFILNHNLQSEDLITTVIDLSSKEVVHPSIIYTSLNSITVKFHQKPHVDAYKLIIIG
jgi:hypothetical protein